MIPLIHRSRRPENRKAENPKTFRGLKNRKYEETESSRKKNKKEKNKKKYNQPSGFLTDIIFGWSQLSVQHFTTALPYCGYCRLRSRRVYIFCPYILVPFLIKAFLTFRHLGLHLIYYFFEFNLFPSYILYRKTA